MMKVFRELFLLGHWDSLPRTHALLGGQDQAHKLCTAAGSLSLALLVAVPKRKVERWK